MVTYKYKKSDTEKEKDLRNKLFLIYKNNFKILKSLGFVMENNNNKIYKTTQEYRNKVKEYEERVKRENPERYKKRIEYHKNYYKKMKEAYEQVYKLKQLEISS